MSCKTTRSASILQNVECCIGWLESQNKRFHFVFAGTENQKDESVAVTNFHVASDEPKENVKLVKVIPAGQNKTLKL